MRNSPRDWNNLPWSRGLKHLQSTTVPVLPLRTVTEQLLEAAAGAKPGMSSGRGRNRACFRAGLRKPLILVLVLLRAAGAEQKMRGKEPRGSVRFYLVMWLSSRES